MNSLTFKIVFFLLLVGGIGAGNYYVVNGPLLKHNTDVTMHQFDGKTLTTAGDFAVGGYWISFNTVYVFELLFLATIAAILFIPPILRVLFPEPNQ